MASLEDSPWHDGERAVHQRLGIAERMESAGRHVIRDFMPDQHRAFFQQLPFILLGSTDRRGQLWASLLAGAPGFVTSPTPRTAGDRRGTRRRRPAGRGADAGRALGRARYRVADAAAQPGQWPCRRGRP
ncbi:MAG: hypothetical protein WDN69_13185 [Aliidongia sp.]